MISMGNHVIWNSLKALDNVLSVFTWNSIDAVCVESWLVDMWNTVHPKSLLLLPFNLIHEADFSVALLFLSQPKPSKLCCIDFQIHLIFEILINFWTFFLCWCIYRSTIYMINYNCFFLFFGGWKSIFKLKLLIIILCLRFFFFFFLSLFWVNFWCFEIVDIGYDMILNHWIVWNSLMRVLIHWDKNKIIHIRYTCRCTHGKCLPLVIAIFHQHKPLMKFRNKKLLTDFNSTQPTVTKKWCCCLFKKMKHTKNQMQTPIIIIKIKNEKSFQLQTRIRNPIWMI